MILHDIAYFGGEWTVFNSGLRRQGVANVKGWVETVLGSKLLSVIVM